MESEVARKEKSLAVLQRLLAPVVHIWVWRRRLKRAAREAVASLVSLPDEAVLRSDPLLSAWSVASLQRLRDGATVIHREAGMTLALAKEPRRVSGVYWLLSGKVTQVPTKSETRECAMEVPTLKDRTGALTGAVVFPSLFARSHAAGYLESSPHRVALVPAVETVLDSLQTFSSGRLVDGAALMLSSLRQRALRCQVASTLLFIPCALLDQELQLLRGTPLRTTRDAAKSCLVSAIARRGDRPSLRAILSHSPLLGTLDTAVLRRVHAQLEPHVFGVGDVVCADVFTTDTVYFLRRGRVLVRNARGAEAVQHSVGVAIGLHSFVPYECPLYFEERRTASARTYCELWGLSLAVLLRICDAQGRLACATHVSRTLRLDSSALAVSAALRAAPCFSMAADDTISSVIKGLRVHVGLPGDCLLSSRRPAKGGVLVMCGQSVLDEHRADVTRTPVQCGVPLYFCESFAGVKAPQAIYAESACLVLYGSPSSILSQIDLNGGTYEETRLIVESAKNYVEHVYGRVQLERGKAQEQAAQRIKAYDQKQKLEAAKDASARAGPPSQDAAVDNTEIKLALENQVMTSLALQLQSLHGDPLAAERFKHLHGLDKDVAWRPATTCAPHTESQSARSAGCFTLDENGTVVHTTAVPTAELRRGSSATSARPEGYDVRSLAQPEAPPEEARSPTVADASHQRLTASAVLPTPPDHLHGLARQKGVLRTRDLHVPFQDTRAASYTQDRRRSPPPRLEALRREATALTDEAYGINTKAERPRYVPKRL